VLLRQKMQELGKGDAVFQSQALERAQYCSESGTEGPVLEFEGL